MQIVVLVPDVFSTGFTEPVAEVPFEAKARAGEYWGVILGRKCTRRVHRRVKLLSSASRPVCSRMRLLQWVHLRYLFINSAFLVPTVSAISASLAAIIPRTLPKPRSNFLRVAGPMPGTSSSKLAVWRFTLSVEW